MNAVRATTGPFILECIDDTDCNYLKLLFSDGQCRLLAKGGKWPAYIAVNLEIKARDLLKKIRICSNLPNNKAMGYY